MPFLIWFLKLIDQIPAQFVWCWDFVSWVGVHPLGSVEGRINVSKDRKKRHNLTVTVITWTESRVKMQHDRTSAWHVGFVYCKHSRNFKNAHFYVTIYDRIQWVNAAIALYWAAIIRHGTARLAPPGPAHVRISVVVGWPCRFLGPTLLTKKLLWLNTDQLLSRLIYINNDDF